MDQTNFPATLGLYCTLILFIVFNHFNLEKNKDIIIENNNNNSGPEENYRLPSAKV